VYYNLQTDFQTKKYNFQTNCKPKKVFANHFQTKKGVCKPFPNQTQTTPNQLNTGFFKKGE